MLIEITEQDRIRERLLSLKGIEDGVRLEVGEHAIPGEFELGRSKEDNLSAVQYVRFRFDTAPLDLFVSGRVPSRLVVDHANYRATAVIEEAVRRSLAADLSETA
jgi:hypothetical protein